MACPQYECEHDVSTHCPVNIYLHNAGIHVNVYIGFIAFQGDCIAFQGVFLLFRVILERL